MTIATGKLEIERDLVTEMIKGTKVVLLIPNFKKYAEVEN